MVVSEAPWLSPNEYNAWWMIPSAVMVLLIPIFFVSVFFERWAFDWNKQLDSSLVKEWSWKANLVTYGIMEILFIGIVAL